MDIEAVVNCGAGSVDGEQAEAEVARVRAALEAAGADARVRAVTGPRLEEAVADAVRRGAQVVAVAGGDGSIGTAAAAVAGSDAALGVLPLGTFNHFARDLEGPDDLEGAARVVVEGRDVTVDIAEVNGRTFVNNSSIGLYPVMVDLRDEIRDGRGWGKVRAVPLASLRVLRRFPSRRMRITVGDQEWRLRTPFVFVGNNRYEVGPQGVGARTDLDRGELCCYVATATTRLGFVRMALNAALRGATSTPHLESACAPEVTIDVHGHRVLVAVDGEVDTLRSPLRYRVRPGALRVRVPEAAEPPPGPPQGPPAEAGVEHEA